MGVCSYFLINPILVNKSSVTIKVLFVALSFFAYIFLQTSTNKRMAYGLAILCLFEHVSVMKLETLLIFAKTCVMISLGSYFYVNFYLFN